MKYDWRAAQGRYPWQFKLIVVTKAMRTYAAILVGAGCVAVGIHTKSLPLDLLKPDWRVAVGLVLIVAGVAFRLAAHGCLRKKEVLATTGVYSLLRHPLYLGSILLTYGFCFLFNNLWYFVAATVYFLIFYTLTIVWEEIRVAERYGPEHGEWAKTTPLLLPLGKFRRGEFLWSQAMRKGGAMLIGLVIVMLIGVEVLAKKLIQI